GAAIEIRQPQVADAARRIDEVGPLRARLVHFGALDLDRARWLLAARDGEPDPGARAAADARVCCAQAFVGAERADGDPVDGDDLVARLETGARRGTVGEREPHQQPAVGRQRRHADARVVARGRLDVAAHFVRGHVLAVVVEAGHRLGGDVEQLAGVLLVDVRTHDLLQHDLQRRELRLRQVAAPRDERTQRERADDQQPDGGEEPQRWTRGLRHASDPTAARRVAVGNVLSGMSATGMFAAGSSPPSACSTQSCLLIFGGSASFEAAPFASPFASAFLSAGFFSSAFFSSAFFSPALALPASSATSAAFAFGSTISGGAPIFISTSMRASPATLISTSWRPSGGTFHRWSSVRIDVTLLRASSTALPARSSSVSSA